MILLLSSTILNSAVLWKYESGLHTTVIETKGGGYLFRYNYVPDKPFQFPNVQYVKNYHVEYEKETFEYGESIHPPIWGTVMFDGKCIHTHVPSPIPEPQPQYAIILSMVVGMFLIRRK